jgi:NAD(P)-dependent dehydrogenase (short-subunit alcohol dehydrogenase family)
MVREIEAKPGRIPIGRFGKIEEVAGVVTASLCDE